MRLTDNNISEAELEEKLRQACKKRKARCLKYYNPSDTGWPDREILTADGRTIWVELKRPHKGKLSPIQKVRRAWLIRNGHAYFQIDNLASLVLFIKRIL